MMTKLTLLCLFIVIMVGDGLLMIAGVYMHHTGLYETAAEAYPWGFGALFGALAVELGKAP